MNSNKFAEQRNEISKVYKERAPQHTSLERENGDPNIFEILGIENKEVLICRVLGDLLNPHGKINGGNDEPLRLFIKDVLSVNRTFGENDLNDAEIVLEEVTDKNRRVDIVIKIGGSIYPLEVKIGAVDQPSQLFDYYRYYFGNQQGKTIYYLTPTGKEPSLDSIESKDHKSTLDKNKKEYMPISFEKNISKWLSSIELPKFSETAQFIFTQFKEVIEKMAEEYQAREALYAALGYTETSGFKNEEYNQLLLTIVDNHEDIKRKFQQHYICKHCDLDKYPSYTLLKVTEEEIKEDKHRVLKVMTEGRTIAWICIDTNLYIATKNEAVNEYDKYKWKKDSGYYWRHLYYDKEKFSPIELSNIKKYLKKEDTILIGDILKYCE